MKMQKNSFFPSVEPRAEFREKLKLEVLDLYNQQTKPVFSWKWLFAPSMVVASLVLVVLVQNRPIPLQAPMSQPASQFSAEESGNTTVLPGETDAIQGSADTWSGVQENADFTQLENNIYEISQNLDTDADLDAAIAFRNL